MQFPIPRVQDMQQALGLPSLPVFIKPGGFKAVYRMQNARGENEALKAIFLPTATTDEETLVHDQLVARAKREIAALQARPSQHLVTLGSVPAQMHHLGGYDYLVYSEEFLQGDPLDRWIGRQPPPTFAEIRTLFQTLIGLIRDLSQIGYLHRDIKPDNVIATGLPERPFVLLDLGIAYKMHGTELTQGGGPPGTLRYMAPELLKPDYKDNMDFRCDLYAAGLTVYVVASGTHPFAPRPESQYATAYRIIHSTPQPLASYRGDFPSAFCSIIDRCIRKRPALRYAPLELVDEDLGTVAP
jgi:serine/threonine-protein kinase